MRRQPIDRCIFLTWVAFLTFGQVVRADWRTDSGFGALQLELGVNLPTGAGVEVLHVEANSTTSAPYDYLPEAGGPGDFSGSGMFSGKTFHPLSGAGLASGHAFAVGSHIYGASSMSSGVTSIHAMRAQDYFDGVLSLVTPSVFPGKVQNHSWIGNATVSAIRKFDFMVNRDQPIVVVGLNNGSGTSVPPLLGESYHAISVGVRNGEHSRNGTILSDGPQRMKPDLVVNESSTSLATGGVSSAAVLLCAGATQSGLTHAARPQVIKSILVAGASKSALPAWRRTATNKPYDSVWGAGELNIQNAWRIQAGGVHSASNTVEVPVRGWNYAVATTAHRYFFSVPAGALANRFSAALTWHRTVNALGTSSTVPNLSLKLFAASSFTPSALPIDQSVSTVDNTEHVFYRHLPAGQYMLEVTASTTDTAYALAWEAQIAQGPPLTVTRQPTQVVIAAAELDPFVTYMLQSSENLTDWADETAIRTADMTPSFTYSWNLPTGGSVVRRFYRLSWLSPRS